LERKNGWTLAELAGESSPDRLDVVCWLRSLGAVADHVGMAEVAGWAAGLEEVHARIASRFSRSEACCSYDVASLLSAAAGPCPEGSSGRTRTFPKPSLVLQLHLVGSSAACSVNTCSPTASGKDTLLFTSTNGNPISRNNFRTKVWLPAFVTAGLKTATTFHGLRAAHASWLLAGGADLQVVKERLVSCSSNSLDKW